MLKEQTHNIAITDSDIHKINGKSSFGSLSKYIQISCWLSLDVVFGAMLCNVMVFKLMHISQIPWIQISVFGATVWVIYLFDHLWDVKNLSIKPKIERRLFFYNNFNIIGLLVILLLLITFITSILFLPTKTIYFGTFTGLFVAFYLIIVHLKGSLLLQKWFHKEVLVGILYGVGVWGSAMIFADRIEMEHFLLLTNFILVAFLNLLIFSFYEIEEDIQQEQISMVLFMGKNTSKKTFLILLILIMILGGIIISISQQRDVQNWVFLEWSMASILFLLTLFPDYFKKNDAYRILGDGVFILPGILWFFNSI